MSPQNRSRAGSRFRTASAAALALSLGLALSILPTAANAVPEVPGGTTAGTAVTLPVADLDSSFVATNVGSSSAGTRASQPWWYNTTWFSYTPVSTTVVYVRATSLTSWDNTLEIWTAAGALVAQNDDSYGLDAALRVTLEGGVSYRLAMGGYRSSSKGAATLTFSQRVPSAPIDVAATAGDALAAVTWTAPTDLAGGVTRYSVYCTPEGGAQTLCATLNGTPPSTSTTVTGLTNGTTYAISVTATNLLGPSVHSAPASAMPTGPSAVSVSTDPGSLVSGAPFDVVVDVTSHGDPVPGGTVDVTVAGAPHAGLALVAGRAVVAGVTSLVGNVVIDASYSGTVGITSSTDQLTAVVAKRGQSVALTVLPTGLTIASDPIPLLGTATSELPVTLSASGACALSDAVLHLVGVGTCTITATQAGDAQTEAASATQSVAIARRPQSVTLDAIPDLVYGQTTTLVASSSLSRAVTLSASGACTVADGELTAVGVGACTVTASEAGDAETDSASATQATSIDPRPQVVTLDELPSLVYLQTATLEPASSVDLTVALVATGTCTITGRVLTASGVGLCTVTASQAGDELNAAATDVVRTVEIGKRPQTITIPSLTPLLFGLAPVVVNASSDRGFDVTVVGTGACVVTAGVLSTIGSGECVLVASALGDEVTEAGSATMTLDVEGVPSIVTSAIAADLGDGARGAAVSAQGEGLIPGTDLVLEVRSTPQVLGTVIVGAAGTAVVSGVLPDLEAGSHELVAYGSALDGSQARVVLLFEVSEEGNLVRIADRVLTSAPAAAQPGAAPLTGSALPQTGAEPAVMLLLGGLWIAVGAVLVRRRRRLA